jgi:hypothetical protein
VCRSMVRAGGTHFAGLDRKRTRSSRRMEGCDGRRGDGLRAVTAYAVGGSAARGSASVTVWVWVCWGVQSGADGAVAVGLRPNLGEETGEHFFSAVGNRDGVGQRRWQGRHGSW